MTKRTFEARHKEHAKGAELKTASDMESKFFLGYPTKQTALSIGQQSGQSIIGSFENLELLCGLDFSRSEPIHTKLYETGEDSIFV